MSTARQAGMLGAVAVASVAFPAVALVPSAQASTTIPDVPSLGPPGNLIYGPSAKALVTKIISESAGHTAVIKSGDTLSGIATRYCGNSDDWTGIWHQNKSEIHDPDVVLPGQVVRFTCEEIKSLLSASGQGGGPVVTAAHLSTPEPVSGAPVSTAGMGGFEQCVIARESGGNAQVMNSTGHYGLYQFSESTWVAYGGSSADFGHASAGEQRQVFLNAMATAGGAGNWAPYDGC